MSERTLTWWSLALALALSGCAHSLGYAGSHPGGVYCKGKVALSVNGGATVAAVFGGGEMNGASVQADCGENGGYLIQGNPDDIVKLMQKDKMGKQ